MARGAGTPHYAPDQQRQVDQRRLAYDEFILTADRAFGVVHVGVRKERQAANTTVIVSADHGESFEGGIYQHENQYMTRPVIHIPLIIRTPDQQQGRSVSLLPPTRPRWRLRFSNSQVSRSRTGCAGNRWCAG